MTRHQTTSMPGGLTRVEVRCDECGEEKHITVAANGYQQWLSGTVIQNALPELPKEDRELLISGVCGPCFDGLFPK